MTKAKEITGVAVAEGWRFYTADFSIDGQMGRVTLKRDQDGTKWFHSLSEKEQEDTELFVPGFGHTIAEAVVDANARVAPRAAAQG